MFFTLSKEIKGQISHQIVICEFIMYILTLLLLAQLQQETEYGNHNFKGGTRFLSRHKVHVPV